jgi:primary-amine oxidase
MIDLWSSGKGYFDEPEYGPLRIGKPLLFLKDSSDKIGGGYGRPIFGVTPVVDLNAKKVIAVEDIGIRPTPPEQQVFDPPADFSHSVGLPLQPIEITQPKGPSFVLEGHHVQWQGWDLRIGFNAREGLTLHNIQIWDSATKALRPVMYRASLAEMVVPYGDPERPNYRKNAFDAGEEGLGFNANSLKLGCDCVGEVKYLDAIVCNALGEAEVIQNAICIHEEDAGVLWKHTNWRTASSKQHCCP